MSKPPSRGLQRPYQQAGLLDGQREVVRSAFAGAGDWQTLEPEPSQVGPGPVGHSASFSWDRSRESEPYSKVAARAPGAAPRPARGVDQSSARPGNADGLSTLLPALLQRVALRSWSANSLFPPL